MYTKKAALMCQLLRGGVVRFRSIFHFRGNMMTAPFKKMIPKPTPRKEIGAYNWLYDIDSEMLYFDENAGPALYREAAMICLHIPYGKKVKLDEIAAIYCINSKIKLKNVAI